MKWLKKRKLLYKDIILIGNCYFLNWQNEKDSLHISLKQLWALVDYYEPLQDKLQMEYDSLRSVFYATGNKSDYHKAESVPRLEIYKDYQEKRQII